MATQFHAFIRKHQIADTVLAWLVSKGMNKVSLREAAERQEQSERLTDAVLSFVEGIGVIKSYNLLGEKSESTACSSVSPSIIRFTVAHSMLREYTEYTLFT